MHRHSRVRAIDRVVDDEARGARAGARSRLTIADLAWEEPISVGMSGPTRRLILLGALGAVLIVAGIVSLAPLLSAQQTPPPATARTSAAPVPSGSTVPSLKHVFADSFAVGAAVDASVLTGDHADLLATQFNSVTPTSAMKWTTTEPAEGKFDFRDADTIVKFAMAHGFNVRGHTLVWYRQVPSWVFQDADGKPMTATPENKALLLERLDSHIRNIVGRYRGQVRVWDVANEVLADDGSLRDSPWYQIAGLDYIKQAFVTAHEADPSAELCVNDFDLTKPNRRDGMYELIRQLLADGVPVDCVGSQMHGNIAFPNAADTAAAIDKFAKLGVDQQITELDISVYTDGTSSYPTIPADLLSKQAAAYKALFGVYRSRRDKISSVTFWGLADDDTWLDSYPINRTDAPLLFDAKLRPKPAFWAVVGVAG